jgi:hypothetical protein
MIRPWNDFFRELRWRVDLLLHSIGFVSTEKKKTSASGNDPYVSVKVML